MSRRLDKVLIKSGAQQQIHLKNQTISIYRYYFQVFLGFYERLHLHWCNADMRTLHKWI